MKRNSAQESPETLNRMMRLGEALKRARVRRRLTQAQLGERAGISSRTLRRLEGGDPGFALGSFLEVLAVLEPDWPDAFIDPVEADAPGRTLEDARLPRRVDSGDGF